MKIKRFSTPSEFQSQALDFLVRHEAENNLPIGILNGMIAGEFMEYDPYLGYVEVAGEPQIAALCTPPYPVILSYQDPDPEQAIITLLLEDLIEFLGEGFRGINGPKALAENMKGAWEAISGTQAQLIMAMRIYKLEKVIFPEDVPGAARAAGKADEQLMTTFYAGFNRSVHTGEPDPEIVKKQVDRYLHASPKMRGLWFWEVNGEPVSMAGYAGPTPNGIRIGAVYTPPEHRRKGYATAVTAALSSFLLDQGYQFCFLFTDLLNPTSNHIYQQIGYRPVCDVDRYDFR